MLKDYYTILGISTQATPVEIKQAYRKLAKQYHPDVVGNSTADIQHFNTIKEAYETLTNTTLLNAYKQARWLYKAEAKQMEKTEKRTLTTIFIQLIALDKEVHYHTIQHLNAYVIATLSNKILDNTAIAILNENYNKDTVHKVMQYIVKLVTYTHNDYVQALLSKLVLLNNEAYRPYKVKLVIVSNNMLKQQNRKRYSWLWVALLTLFLLAVLYSIVT